MNEAVDVEVRQAHEETEGRDTRDDHLELFTHPLFQERTRARLLDGNEGWLAARFVEIREAAVTIIEAEVSPELSPATEIEYPQLEALRDSFQEADAEVADLLLGQFLVEL